MPQTPPSRDKLAPNKLAPDKLAADKPPDKLREPGAQLFRIAADGRPAVARLNIGLVAQ